MNYFDLHCDTLLNLTKDNTDLFENEYHISLKKAEKIKKYVQVYAVFVRDNFFDDGGGFLEFEKHVNYLNRQLELHKNKILLIKNNADFQNAMRNDGNYAILSMEGAIGIDDDLENLTKAKEMGCKMITVTWNGENYLCYGADYTKGLKPFGKQAIARMEKENIIVDVSHANDWGMDDILSMTSKPVVASHSNVRGVWPHKRNLSDEHFKEIAKRGGLVGLNFYRHFLNGENSTVADIANHIEYMLALGGENSVAMGSDFDGADLPKDLQNLAQVRNLYQYLLKKMNYSQELVDKLFFDNAKTFFTNYFANEG